MPTFLIGYLPGFPHRIVTMQFQWKETQSMQAGLHPFAQFLHVLLANDPVLLFFAWLHKKGTTILASKILPEISKCFSKLANGSLPNSQ